MLHLVSGPFHSFLEDEFAQRVKELNAGSMNPVVVVAPSSRMMDRLQTVLARKGQAVLNVQFHTMASLIQSVVDGAGGLKKPVLSDPLFFDTLVKFILKETKPFQGMSDLAVPEGFPPAVRGTLRDLVDAGVPADARVVAEAVKEDFLGRKVDVGTLFELLYLYQTFRSRARDLPYSPRWELNERAIELAPSSQFLKPFHEIIFYGFYDMTGRQADFFQTVVKNFPSRMYFPYVKDHPAYGFAGRFRDTFLQPVMGREVQSKKSKIQDPKPTPACRTGRFKIISVSGLRDEAWVIAGEIRRLHEEEGVPFHEMAVVAG